MRRGERTLTGLSLAVLTSLLLAACGGGGKTTGDTVQEGGTLIIGSNQEAKSMHPYMTEDLYSSQREDFQYDGRLMERDSNLNFRGMLADNWKFSDDQLTITFNLKKDLKWSDGEALTADDIQWTFDRFMDPKNNYSSRQLFSQIGSLKATDPRTIVVKLKEVYAPVLDRLTFRVLPKHTWEKLNWADNPQINAPTVGSGPWILQEWKKDDQATFKVNPNYVKGKPHLDKVIWKVYPNSTALFVATKNGEVDLAGVAADNYVDAKQAPSLTLDEYFTAAGSWQYVGFNLRKPEFQDVRVRRAMTHALDRKTVIAKVLNGLGVQIDTDSVPANPFYTKEVEKNAYNFDPAKAKQLLDEAGWKVGADGIREKDGKKMKFRYGGSTGNKVIQDTFTFYQQWWKDVGIDVRADFQEFQSLLRKVQADNPDFDLVTLGWSATIDPDAGRSKWRKGDKSRNFVGYDGDKLESLYNEGTKTFDINKRKPIYAQIYKQLHDDQPYIFGWSNKLVLGKSSKVGGVQGNAIGYLHDYDRWYAKSKK